MDRETLEYFVEMGIYFGYPACCIFNFLKRYDAIHTGKDITTIEQSRVSGSGFVPCQEHAQQILKKQITIHELISQNRKCKKPFPYGD